MSDNYQTGPIGRLVWGDPTKAEPVMDDATKQPKRDAAGAVIMEYAFGVAYAKNDPAWPAYREWLKQHDRAAWPQFHGPDGEVMPGVKFADKITDGDGYNTKGQLHSLKDGYAGHWIVKYGSRFPGQVVRWENNAWVQDMTGQLVQPGDYIRVNGSTQTNNSNQSPGMYRNWSMVAFQYKGTPIQKGPDPNATFGGPPPAAPAGAYQPPPMPAAPVHPAAPPAAPAYQPPQPVAPAAPAPGYGGYAQPPGPPVPGATPSATPAPAVPAAPSPVPPTPSPGRVMTAKAGGSTYEQFTAQGWTDAQLIAEGYMTA